MPPPKVLKLYPSIEVWGIYIYIYGTVNGPYFLPFEGTGMGLFVQVLMGQLFPGAEAVFALSRTKTGISIFGGGRVHKMLQKLWFLFGTLQFRLFPCLALTISTWRDENYLCWEVSSRTEFLHLFWGSGAAIVLLVKCLQILCFVVYSSPLPLRWWAEF